MPDLRVLHASDPRTSPVPIAEEPHAPDRPASGSLSILGRATPGRGRVERFLERAYARAFGGRIRSHYPQLMCLSDAAGNIVAAVGFRFASEEELFLEHYLDVPAERAIGAAMRACVARDAVVEIGNLASSGQGAAVGLFLGLASHLDGLGGGFAVATATRPLRRIFRRAGFDTVELGRADPTRLPDGGADWGRYYAADPVVIAGAIGPSLAPLRRLLAGVEGLAESDGLPACFSEARP